MKKLTNEQVLALQKFKRDGGIHVYLPIRKHFDSWYVRIFHVDNLLRENEIPSYWYKGLGDCTMIQAEKDGCKDLRFLTF